MADPEIEKEKNAIDMITDSMCSLDFLQGITNVIFSPNRDSMTVGQFYDEWLKASGIKEPKIPFSLGAIIGCLYCGILLVRENWYHLLPEKDITSTDFPFRISRDCFHSPEVKNPTLKYTVRRIRNALGHGRFNILVPKENIKDRSEIMTKFAIDFHDENPKNPKDTFDIKLSLMQLSDIIKMLQSAIHQDVRSRIK